MPVFRLDGDAFPSPDAPAGKPAGNMALPAWFTDGVTVGLVGDALMEPLPGERAHVGIATADTAFRNGAIFAVRTARAGVIVRRAYMDAEEAHIVLRANDPGCPPLRLDRQECSRRVAGRVAWTLQRMG